MSCRLGRVEENRRSVVGAEAQLCSLAVALAAARTSIFPSYFFPPREAAHNEVERVLDCTARAIITFYEVGEMMHFELLLMPRWLVLSAVFRLAASNRTCPTTE